MVNYNNGKIYRIVPNCEHEQHEQYIGSTTNEYLSQRMTQHRSQYKRWKDGKTTLITSFLLYEKYGVDNCSIILIENVNVSTKEELQRRERKHIENIPCVNKNIPLRTKKEWTEDNYEHERARRLKYDEEHTDHIREKRKEYYFQHQSKYMEYAREYVKENKDEIRERRIQAYLKNREEYLSEQNLKRINQPTVLCECGGEYKLYNKARHCKTKTHQAFICSQSL